MSSTPAPPAEAVPRRSLRAALEIPRPHNCAIAFASVLLGGWLGARAFPLGLLVAAGSAALITGGGNTLNDVCDVRVDRVNRPSRPLPSRRLSVRSAFIEALLLLAAGLGTGLSLPRPAPEIALFATVALILYNRWLKRLPLAGNLTVGTLGALAFVYGGAAVGRPAPALIPAVFALLFHLGREILKDIEDSEGDRLRPNSTLVLRWGQKKAAVLLTAIYLLLIGITPLPAILGHYGLRYTLLVSILDLLLFCILWSLWRNPAPRNLGRLSRLLKFGMLLGLSAIFFDQI